jgi:hypothetical protein
MPDTVMTTEATGLTFRNRSNETAKLAAALAAAQKNFAPVPKDREVTVTTQQGGTYKFKYATLDAIMSATMPALSEQGLAISQALTDWGNNYAVETTLYHSSGEWISNVTPMFLSGRRTKDGRELPPGNQELGSAQSYARRYGVTALLCITADEDDDGNHADGNHAEGAERVPYKPGPKGSAGGGTQFRPERRQMPTNNWTEDARRDGTLDELRKKGTLPEKGNANGATAQAAIKRVEWVKAAIDGFKTAQTKAELQDWWRTEAARLEVIENSMPAEYERLLAAYDAAIERTAARAA